MRMKTYAESRGEKPFDWNAFLARAKAGNVTNDEWSNAAILANDWVTCACGNQCAIIPRHAPDWDWDSQANSILGKGGRPVDNLLTSKGWRFYTYIFDREVDQAIECLAEIEHRAAQLIHAINTGTEAP